MELGLNLEWVALAAMMCWLWLRHARRQGPARLVQLIGLALVLVTMFVVITTYDDMAMAQNPAETRCFQREDDRGGHAHAPLHPVAHLVGLSLAKPSSDLLFSRVPATPQPPALKLPAANSIQNRPPPAL